MSSSDARSPLRDLKVGYVLKRFPRLSETFILNEVLELERQGASVEIFSLKRPLDEPRHGGLDRLRAAVHYVSGRKPSDIATLPFSRDVDRLTMTLSPAKNEVERAGLWNKAQAIAELARTSRVQHLHAHFASDSTSAALLSSRLAGLPFSFTAHARDIYHCYVSREVDDAARARKMSAAAFVATVSDFNRRHLQSIAAPMDGGKIVRLYNGIDLDRFSPRTSKRVDRRTILYVGRLIEKKGIADLIEACALLKRSGFGFTCNIVGDGPLHSVLHAQITAAGLEDRVILDGALPQERVLEMMQTAGVLVVPSVVSASGDQDGLPTVLLEAIAVGLPAISTRVAGIPEIIEHRRSGLLVDPHAPNQLADAIAQVLTNEMLSHALSVAGRRRAVARFDLEKNVRRLARLFSMSRSASIRSQEINAHSLYLR